MKISFPFLSIVLVSGIMIANIYNSIVDAPSWGSDIPASIQTMRDYFKVYNPGNFYRTFSPVSILSILLSLVLFWKRSVKIRLMLGAALIMLIGADLFTFGYFYPRNEIMLKSDIQDTETLRMAWQQWSSMNYVRSGIVAVSLIFLILATDKIYKTQK